jgi:hypothetical protein
MTKKKFQKNFHKMLKFCGMMNILFWVKPHDGAFPK